MGYACPVCGDPQADAGHLANHLAFTAMTRGDEHEEWLDEHAPDWEDLGESELAAEVSGEAEETEFPQVFEASNLAEGRDGGGHDHGDGHDHGGQGHAGHDHSAHGHDHGVDPAAARSRGRGELDDEAREILAEARSITEEMQSGEGGGDAGNGEEENDEAADDVDATDDTGGDDGDATDDSG